MTAAEKAASDAKAACDKAFLNTMTPYRFNDFVKDSTEPVLVNTFITGNEITTQNIVFNSSQSHLMMIYLLITLDSI